MSSSKPLSGKRIVVTRNLESAGRLSRRLEDLGAEVLALPLIRIEYGTDPLEAGDVFSEIGSYEWVVFTSANGVRGFFDLFFKAFEDIRSFGFMRIAAVGEATAAAIREWHLKVDLQPETATAEALSKALREEQSIENIKLLVVTGNRNRADLVKNLEEAQAIVDSLEVYRTELADLANDPGARQFREKGADVLVFASSSAVQSFGQQAQNLKLEKGAKVPALASFGPQTSDTMRKAKIPLAIEAATPSLDAMVDAIVAYFEKK
jgi:uroporphyrinogen-III synthase